MSLRAPGRPRTAREILVDLLQTSRAHAMREYRVGVSTEVGLYLVPISAIVSDLLAARTDRQQSGQDLDLIHRCLEVPILLPHVAFEGVEQRRHGVGVTQDDRATQVHHALEHRGGDPDRVRRRMGLCGRFGEPTEIAQAALWLWSDASSFTTGHTLAVDGGFLAY